MGSRLLALSALVLLALPSAAGPAMGQGSAAGGGPSPAAAEWFDGVLELSMDTVEEMRVHADLQVHKITFQGRVWTADDLRQTYRSFESRGLGGLFLGQMEGVLADRIEASARSLFPKGTVTMEGTEVVGSSLAGPEDQDPYQPPVEVTFDATVDHRLEDLGLGGANLSLTPAKVQTLFEVGMQLALSYPLRASPGWNLTYAFTLPPWLRLREAAGSDLLPDGRGAAWKLLNWDGDQPLVREGRLILAGRDAPAVTSTEANVAIGVDMQDVEGLSIPGLLGGDLGQLAVRFTATMLLEDVVLDQVPALARAVRSKLPANVEVAGLNADGLRLAVRDGLLAPDVMDRLEGELQRIAEARLAAFHATSTGLEGGFTPASLDPALISDPLDNGPPVAYEVQAKFLVPLKAATGGKLAAALTPAVAQRKLTFAVPAIEGLATSYRIVLPPGIALADVQATGARAERGSEGGRDFVVLTPEQPGATAVLTFALTGDFVLAKFWYVWLVLLAGLAAAGYGLRRKFGRRSKAQPPEAPPAPSEPATGPPPLGEDVAPGPGPEAETPVPPAPEPSVAEPALEDEPPPPVSADDDAASRTTFTRL